jgi:hypothetical protein
VGSKPTVKDVFASGHSQNTDLGDAVEADNMLDHVKVNPSDKVDFHIIGQDTKQDLTNVLVLSLIAII